MRVEDKAREIRIHQSANRPHLLLGGDRELVLCAGLTAAALAFIVATWWSLALGMMFWIASVAALARMGKADPMLRHVYLKHIRYAGFYPAKSGIFSRSSNIPRTWK